MVIYYGNDLDQINNQDLKCNNPLKIDYLDDVSSIYDELNQISLFNQPDAVFIYNAIFLLDEDQKSSALINYLTNYEIEVYCFIKNDKLDNFNPSIKNKKIKTIKKTQINAFNKAKEVMAICDELKVKTDDYQTYNYLVDCLPDNYLMIKNELNKLLIYSEGKLITKKDIDEILIDNGESNIFSLINYLLQNNIDICINLYENLINLKHQPIEMIQIMATQLFKIKLFKKAITTSSNLDATIKELRITPYQAKQLSYVYKIPLSKIEKIEDAFFDLDCNIKKGLVDPYQGLKYLISSVNLIK